MVFIILFPWQNGFISTNYYIDSLNGAGKLSDEFLAYYNSLIDICSNYTSVTLLEQTIEDIKGVEADIAISGVDSLEKVILLGGASVMRHSAVFWSSIRGSNSYVIMSPSDNSNFPSWRDSAFLSNVYDGKDGWDERKTVEADFSGFVTGGIAGCLCGPAGMGAGAILGMYGNSAMDIFWQWQHGWHFPATTTDPLGGLTNPKIDYGLNGGILECRYNTIVRPDSLVIRNSENVVFYSTDDIPNFEKSNDVSNFPSGMYSMNVYSNLGLLRKSFVK